MCPVEDGRRGPGQRGDAQPDARGPAVPLPVPRSRRSPCGNELPFDCAFISPAFFSPLFLNTLSALSDLSLLFPASVGAVWGDGPPGQHRGVSVHHPGGGFRKMQVVRGPGSYFGQG